MKVLVIGESCLDVFQYGKCERLSPELPVPVFVPTTRTENPGMAGNVKNNLIALGADVHVHTNANWQSITKTRLVEHKNNHMFIRIDEHDGEYGRSDLKTIDFNLYDAVIISDYNKGFLTEAEIKFIAISHPLTFLDTKKPVGNWCKNISYIKINNSEFQKAKGNLTKDVINRLIITLGPDGAQHCGKIYPVPKVETRDVAGAGDTFISALCVKMIDTKKIEEAIKFANTCATRVVQKRGVTTV